MEKCLKSPNLSKHCVQNGVAMATNHTINAKSFKNLLFQYIFG